MRGIEYIERYLNLMIEKGLDIKENYFILTLNEKNGKSGKVYVPDIKLVKEDNKISNKNNSNNSNNNNPKNQNSSNNSQKGKENKQNDNCYKYVKGEMVEYAGQKIPKLLFVKRDGKQNIVYLTKESKKDILKLKPGTLIAITKINKDKNNMIFLKDYNVLKAVEQQKNIIEKTKKAV